MNKSRSRAEHKKEDRNLEAKAALFSAKMNQKPLEPRFRNMLTEVDFFDPDRKVLVWDLHVKYPFKIPIATDDLLRNLIKEFFTNLKRGS